MITTIMIMLFTLMLAVPVMAKKPTAINVTLKATWFSWSASASSFGSWSSPPYWDDWLVFMSITVLGNLIKKTLYYGIPVSGASTVYVYNKMSGDWIQHEGTVNYVGGGGLLITEYLRGFLRFSGTPSTESFVHGILYRWAYVYGADETTVKAGYPYAVWDTTMGAWLVAFNIYLYDAATYTQSYTTPFPSPFIEPVPASNYNPLGL